MKSALIIMLAAARCSDKEPTENPATEVLVNINDDKIGDDNVAAVNESAALFPVDESTAMSIADESTVMSIVDEITAMSIADESSEKSAETNTPSKNDSE